MKTRTCTIIVLGALILSMTGFAFSQLMPKAQVGNLIAKVEDGVDEFRDYLKDRGDKAKDNASAAKSRGATGRRRGTDAQRANATATKDDLDDALGDLNRSTNRLRRKFDPADTWMDTKGRAQKVVDDAREINTVISKGKYGTDVARLWSVLRTGINDLARAYGIAPLGI